MIFPADGDCERSVGGLVGRVDWLPSSRPISPVSGRSAGYSIPCVLRGVSTNWDRKVT